jgi:tRNA U34 5-methylaminomethyl-2-thiouridine-forming methyltransferase MnmC
MLLRQINSPELWTIGVLQKVVDAMKLNGIFVTYCAKGQLKRDLKELGLSVETLPGPPGKKEMVRATKLQSLELPPTFS